MAAHLTDHLPIISANTTSGNTPRTTAINEKSGQTFLPGTPVQLASGVIQAWDGTTVARGIAGIAFAQGANLSSSGKGAPPPFGSVGFPSAYPTVGTVQFQASAVNIPAGAIASDGRTLFEVAETDTIFVIQADNSTGASFTTAITNVGLQYGMAVDTTGHWYLNLNDTTNVVWNVLGLFPADGPLANGRLLVSFIDSACQLIG